MPNVNKDDVDKWIRANYPRIIGNWKLSEELYRTKVLKEDIHDTSKIGIMTYPLSRIVDLKNDIPATIIGVKVRITGKRVSMVCCKCGRKVCLDNHQEGKKELHIVNWYGGDDSGTASFIRMAYESSEVEAIEKSDVLLMQGALRVNLRWHQTEFVVKSFVPVTKEQLTAWESLEDYYLVNGGQVGISEQDFSKKIAGKEELLFPFFEKIFISKEGGRVKW